MYRYLRSEVGLALASRSNIYVTPAIVEQLAV